MLPINTKLFNMSAYWGVGILGLEVSEYWDVGILGCRNSGLSGDEFQWSEYWVVGILGAPHRNISDRKDK